MRKLIILLSRNNLNINFHKAFPQMCFNHVENGLDIYSKFYDKYMLIRDLNAEDSEPCLSLFLLEMNAKNIVSCINLVIKNSSSNIHNTRAILTGLSVFHEMVVKCFETHFS